MTSEFCYLWLALPVVACDLPAKVVGETADPTQGDEPVQDHQDSQDPEDSQDPQDPHEPSSSVEPPTDQVTIVAEISGTLAVDDTWLFVGGGAAPWRVLKSGGEPELVVAEDAEPRSSVQLIALDDTHVYWSGGSWAESRYSILRAPKLGGVPSLVNDERGPNYAVPAAMAVDADYLYVTLRDTLNAGDGFDKLNGVIRRVPKAGGPALDIAKVYTDTIAVDDNYVYWARRTRPGGGELVRADKDGANVEVLAAELGPISVMRVVGDRLYWVYEDAGQQVARTALTGGVASTLFAESGDGFYLGVPAATAGGLYWLRGGDATGGVLSVDLAGVVDEFVTAPASAPYTDWWEYYVPQIVADESAIYWSYGGQEALLGGQTGGIPRIYRIAQ